MSSHKPKKIKNLPQGCNGWWYSGKKSTVHIVFPKQVLHIPIGDFGATLKIPYQHEQLNLELKK